MNFIMRDLLSKPPKPDIHDLEYNSPLAIPNPREAGKRRSVCGIVYRQLYDRMTTDSTSGDFAAEA